MFEPAVDGLDGYAESTRAVEADQDVRHSVLVGPVEHGQLTELRRQRPAQCMVMRSINARPSAQLCSQYGAAKRW